MLQAKYYEAQERHHSKTDGGSITLENFSFVSVDYWRHKRMYEKFNSLITKNSTWVTVGDGRYGHEAHYLESHGAMVTATDISVERLRVAKKSGYIKNYKKENAEKLSFAENSFDYVLCKESYHHFPRPMMALYEMLRVAKKAVILIEPNDVTKRGLSYKQVMGIEDIGSKVNRFEVSGNYVYSTSRREFEKIALGIGLPAISFAGIDDYYEEGMGAEELASHGPKYKKAKIVLRLLDIAFKLGIRDRSLLVSVVFKRMPSKKTRTALESNGFEVINLPKNPYIK